MMYRNPSCGGKCRRLDSDGGLEGPRTHFFKGKTRAKFWIITKGGEGVALIEKRNACLKYLFQEKIVLLSLSYVYHAHCVNCVRRAGLGRWIVYRQACRMRTMYDLPGPDGLVMILEVAGSE